MAKLLTFILTIAGFVAPDVVTISEVSLTDTTIAFSISTQSCYYRHYYHYSTILLVIIIATRNFATAFNFEIDVDGTNEACIVISNCQFVVANIS